MVYVERHFGYVNRYDLNDGRLTIESEVVLGPHTESVFDLREISPNYTKAWVRDGWITKWLIYGSVATLVLIVLWFLALGPNIIAYPKWFIYALLGGVVATLVFSVIHPWRYEMALFSTRNGPVVFVLKKRGKMSRDYETFLAAILASSEKTSA